MIDIGKSFEEINDDPLFPSPGDEMTVIGQGLTAERGERSDVLHEVTVKAVSGDDCRRKFRRITDDNMLCAGTRYV